MEYVIYDFSDGKYLGEYGWTDDFTKAQPFDSPDGAQGMIDQMWSDHSGHLTIRSRQVL